MLLSLLLGSTFVSNPKKRYIIRKYAHTAFEISMTDLCLSSECYCRSPTVASLDYPLFI